jgi:hypothetical protein
VAKRRVQQDDGLDLWLAALRRYLCLTFYTHALLTTQKRIITNLRASCRVINQHQFSDEPNWKTDDTMSDIEKQYDPAAPSATKESDEIGRQLDGVDPVFEAKLVRKLDLFIIPVVMLLYLFSFLDR